MDPSSTPTPSRAARLPAGVPWSGVGVIGVLWVFLINQLRMEWSIDPQYSYGWLVPFFSLYLFWKRWPSRPVPSGTGGKRAWTPVAVVGVALGLWLTRVVFESSPDWRLLHWMTALGVVGLTLAVLVAMGGWPSMAHFAWPVCFILVAVPWPTTPEIELTQYLMRGVAAVAVEILSWLGMYAVPQGNLIGLSTGVVGVDEACSGVRSLQSMLMASLFLGELNRSTFERRVALVCIGVALALFFNVARTLILVSLAISKGLAALQAWHDSAGVSILIASFLALCAIAHFCFGEDEDAPDPEALNVAAQGISWRALPAAWVVAALLWWAASEGGTEWWYRAHENRQTALEAWTVRWPTEQPGFKDTPIDAKIRQTLAYNEGRNVSWNEGSSVQWQMFAFKWAPSRTSAHQVRFHKPETCLGATGRVLVEERFIAPVQVGSLELPFRVLHFENGGQPLFVFFCLWEEGARGPQSAVLDFDLARASRLRRVLDGERNLGQQSVEVIVSGLDSMEAAEAAFRAQGARMLVPVPATR